jgi:HlyD family secretion protein
MRHASRLRSSVWLAAVLAASGCHKAPPPEVKSVATPPTVALVRPTVRTIVRTVGQPSFVDAYEQTPIYPKLTAYIEKWVLDIGDKVKKGDLLATLFVPEVREDYQTKKADVEVAKARITMYLKQVDVASADVVAAKARVSQAKASLEKFAAIVERWDSEVKRLRRESDRGVVSPQVLLESEKQHKADIASYDAQKAAIEAAEADQLAREAGLERAKADVLVARAQLLAAQSDERRLAAWVGYLTLTAPYDGIIVARNANTGDFVLPATGDPSAGRHAPDISSDRAAPIFVVARTDVVRVFVDVPEGDANYVPNGTKASVLVKAFRDQPIRASVTRTSWALNVKSRTLRAEIDLHNTDAQILPGMYAYGEVIIERPNTRALPVQVVTYSGGQSFCYLYEGGKSVRTEIQTGVSNGDWIEVTNRRVRSSGDGSTEETWVPFDGSEQVILADLSILADGGPVKVEGADSKAP